jgi:glutamine synthetase
MNQEEIKQLVEKNDIRWIQAHFTDLFGRLKVLHISTDNFIREDMLNRGFGFDGSSVGFAFRLIIL